MSSYVVFCYNDLVHLWNLGNLAKEVSAWTNTKLQKIFADSARSKMCPWKL